MEVASTQQSSFNWYHYESKEAASKESMGSKCNIKRNINCSIEWCAEFYDTCSINNNIEDMTGIQNGLRFSILWSVYCFPKPTIIIGSNNISWMKIRTQPQWSKWFVLILIIIITMEMKSMEYGGASRKNDLAKATQRWIVPNKVNSNIKY